MVKLVTDVNAQLGEGVFWHPEQKMVYWVDIYGRKIHCTDPEKREDRTFELSEYTSSIAPASEGCLIVSLESSVILLNTNTESQVTLIELEAEVVSNRFNDGKCDPFGRYWFGSMCREGIYKTGKLYCLDANLNAEVKIDEVTVSNGIAWDSVRNRMYYIDTPTQCVMMYDYDGISGAISNGKKCVVIPIDMGFPDGMTIDSEGMLWIALWGGYSVVRCNPNTGEFLSQINLPAPNVTSCAFGGTNMDKLYITTAREGMNEHELSEYPLSGGLFVAELPVSGIEVSFFKMNK